jgi:hypothetical protein
MGHLLVRILASIKVTFRLMGPGGHGKSNTTELEIKRIRVQLYLLSGCSLSVIAKTKRLPSLFAAWRPVMNLAVGCPLLKSQVPYMYIFSIVN